MLVIAVRYPGTHPIYRVLASRTVDVLWAGSGNWRGQMQELLVRWLKTPASPGVILYRKAEQVPSPAAEFELSFGGKLATDNRWILIAQLTPWSEFEAEYAQDFTERNGTTG